MSEEKDKYLIRAKTYGFSCRECKSQYEIAVAAWLANPRGDRPTPDTICDHSKHRLDWD